MFSHDPVLFQIAILFLLTLLI